MNVIYFSNVSETTHRLVTKLDVPATTGGQAWRLPLRGEFDAELNGALDTDANIRPYILITPTYGGTSAADRRRHVPPAVVRFLNHALHRAGCIGVIGTGNRNFGHDYGRAGHLIATKLAVPHLATIELSGDHEDILLLQDTLRTLAGVPTRASARLVPAHTLQEAVV